MLDGLLPDRLEPSQFVALGTVLVTDPLPAWIYAGSSIVGGVACVAMGIVSSSSASKSWGTIRRATRLCGIFILLHGASRVFSLIAPAGALSGSRLAIIQGVVALTAVTLWLAPDIVARFHLATRRAGALGTDPARELTRRETTERQLRDSEARYRLLASSTTDAITSSTLGFRYTYASPGCLIVFGCAPGELVNTVPADRMHSDEMEATYALFCQVASGEQEHQDATYRIRHTQGHWVWVEAKLALVRDLVTRQPASITWSIRDVSERKTQADDLRVANVALDRLSRHLGRARDQAERANRAKSRFLAGMSHELRTPLNGILGHAQLLRLEAGLNPVQAGRVEAMLGAGGHLLEMIHCVLDLSEIETEHVGLHIVEVDLYGLVRACLDLATPGADAKGLNVTLELDPDVPACVLTDPRRLRQVLLNLLNNAVKFTTGGAVRLRVRVKADGGGLRFEIADTGPGIPQGQFQRLIEEFERLDAPETRAAEGAGLGLALAARLTTLLGGTLGHRDNPGGGSVFWLELPAKSPALARAIFGPVPATGSPAGRVLPVVMRVLVVDDISINRDIASSFLRSAGHIVTCAESGAQAIEAIAMADFDLVLMDIRMPEMDGLEATRRIRALEGKRGRVPIVALTAQVFTEQVEACRKAGMDGHVIKPFSLETLLAAVTIDYGSSPSMRSVPPSSKEPETDLPVLDLDVFERAIAVLRPRAAASQLRSLAVRSRALLHLVQTPDKFIASALELAESAEQFGYARLAAAGQAARHAESAGPMELARFNSAFAATLAASLSEIENRTPIPLGDVSPFQPNTPQPEIYGPGGAPLVYHID